MSRYLLPYSFARTQQVLLEENGDELTLWLHSGSLLGGISEVSRAKVLGLNAAKVFGFKEILAKYEAKA